MSLNSLNSRKGTRPAHQNTGGYGETGGNTVTGGEISARPLAQPSITNTPPLLGSLILPFVAVPAPLPPHQPPNVSHSSTTCCPLPALLVSLIAAPATRRGRPHAGRI